MDDRLYQSRFPGYSGPRTPDRSSEADESLWVGYPPSIDDKVNLIQFESESPSPLFKPRAAHDEPNTQQQATMFDDDQDEDAGQLMAAAPESPITLALLFSPTIHDFDRESCTIQSVAALEKAPRAAAPTAPEPAATESDDERKEALDGLRIDEALQKAERTPPDQTCEKLTLADELAKLYAKSSGARPRKAAPVVTPIADAAIFRQAMNEGDNAGMYASAVLVLMGALWILLELTLGG